MYTDEVYNRSMGLRYDPARIHHEVDNGVVGYDGELDRHNGLENDEQSGELPYKLFDEASEAGEKAAAYIQQRVEEDVAEFGGKKMSDVEFALDRAFISYGVEFADTSYPMEVAVAEYFGTLANVLLDSKRHNFTPEEVEVIFADITSRLTALDQQVVEEIAA